MTTTLKVASGVLLALTLATGARADDTTRQGKVEGRIVPARDCFPNYPEEATRRYVQGTTVLDFHVDATGKATSVDISRRSGPTHEHRLLDQAAAAALARCPFVPAQDEEGKPVDSVITVHYTWRLE